MLIINKITAAAVKTQSSIIILLLISFVGYIQNNGHKVELSYFRKMRLQYYRDIVKTLEKWLYAEITDSKKIGFLDQISIKYNNYSPLEFEINEVFEHLIVRYNGKSDIGIDLRFIHYEFHLYPTYIEYGLHIENDIYDISEKISEVLSGMYKNGKMRENGFLSMHLLNPEEITLSAVLMIWEPSWHVSNMP